MRRALSPPTGSARAKLLQGHGAERETFYYICAASASGRSVIFYPQLVGKSGKFVRTGLCTGYMLHVSMDRLCTCEGLHCLPTDTVDSMLTFFCMETAAEERPIRTTLPAASPFGRRKGGAGTRDCRNPTYPEAYESACSFPFFSLLSVLFSGFRIPARRRGGCSRGGRNGEDARCGERAMYRV